MESFLDIDIRSCRSFQELHPFATAEVFCLLLLDCAVFLSPIDLVSDHHKGEGLGHAHHGLLQERILPIGNIVEGPTIGDVVDQESTVSSSIESSAQRLIALLTCSIPDLKSHNFAIDGDLFV